MLQAAAHHACSLRLGFTLLPVLHLGYAMVDWCSVGVLQSEIEVQYRQSARKPWMTSSNNLRLSLFLSLWSRCSLLAYIDVTDKIERPFILIGRS